jgi:hypothetical protein
VAIEKLPNATVAATMMTLCRASFFIVIPFCRDDVVPVAAMKGPATAVWTAVGDLPVEDFRDIAPAISRLR